MVPKLEKRNHISSICVRKISADGRLRTAMFLLSNLPTAMCQLGNFTHQRPCILAESRKSYCHIKITSEFILQIHATMAGLGARPAGQLREAPRLHWNNQEMWR